MYSIINWYTDKLVHFIFYIYSNLENKKADNLSRLSAVVLSQNFRAHNIPFLGKILIKGSLNFHLFSFLQRY
ncbi:hypothetical protein RM51_05270 [Chryseobacterium taiwanense]|uniref:Uncharacterized protein n=1 Tax=Chryseobacterium taiwanense TaxID=363331 RepID=A0A0B4D5W5_9FLAO|nr:hypothetical protein RM51_05270 [Chryseobacterium taiwanense]